MLSAIAARKAAQAAQLAAHASNPNTAKNSDSESIYNDEEPEKLAKFLRPLESKRKPSADRDDRRKKKRRRKQATVQSQARYFVAETRGDIIIVDEGDEDKAGTTSSSSESDEGAAFTQRTVSSRRTKRAWSPSQPALESSDDERDNQFVEGTSGYDLEELAPAPLDNGYPTPQALTFVPKINQNIFSLPGDEVEVLSGRRGTIIALNLGDTLALHGVYSLTVIRGVVSVLGSSLSASSTSHQIFAPKCSPLPVIKALANTPSWNFPEKHTRKISSECAVVLLEDLITGVEGLGRVCKLFEDVFGDNQKISDVLGLNTARMVSSLGHTFLPFSLPSSWEKALLTLDVPSPEPPIVLVKGMKRTGKSTLARTLLNHLLTHYRRVAFLECDLGQTEFTPPGLISLTVLHKPVFGPAFTHPILPYASHFIGSTSPRNSPSHYLAAIQALIQTYKLDLQYSCSELNPDEEDERLDDIVPLVVNTMGWTKGLGADLALQTEDLINPTHVSLIQSPFGEQSTYTNEPQYLEVEAIPPDSQTARYNAADWRTISLISYFHSMPSLAQVGGLPPMSQSVYDVTRESQTQPCTWNTSLPLVAQRPYAVDLRKALDNVVLVGAGTEDVVPSEIGRVLNGAIVALVACQPGSVDTTDNGGLPYSQGCSPPDPSTSNCVGLALLRAVSPSLLSGTPSGEEDVLQLLTPLPSSFLAASSCRCIVKGEIELPIWAMLDYRADNWKMGDNVPYLQWSRSEAPGAERRRVRRNLMRRAQM